MSLRPPAARTFLRGLAVVVLSVAAASCATRVVEVPTVEAPPISPGPSVPPDQLEAGLSPASLPGWAEEDHRAALEAWARSCHLARDAAYQRACAAAHALPSDDAAAARRFLEAWFVAERGDETGLLTAYFAPEFGATRTPNSEFDMPVLARPADLFAGVDETGAAVVQRRAADGRLEPYPDRAAIEAEGGEVLAWMRAEDLFFMQIQGSGYLTFEDGSRARAAFAAHNGHRFVGIAAPMVQRGLLPENGTSGEAIRAWLAAHRGEQARAVMALNPRYVFFVLEADDGGEPLGAAGVPLVAGRSIAVDPAHWRYGDLVWIDAPRGNLAGAVRGYRGLVTALDTGGAIRGAVRADFYVGRGDAAGLEAGRVRHPLRMWRLTPRP